MFLLTEDFSDSRAVIIKKYYVVFLPDWFYGKKSLPLHYFERTFLEIYFAKGIILIKTRHYYSCIIKNPLKANQRGVQLLLSHKWSVPCKVSVNIYLYLLENHNTYKNITKIFSWNQWIQRDDFWDVFYFWTNFPQVFF